MRERAQARQGENRSLPVGSGPAHPRMAVAAGISAVEPYLDLLQSIRKLCGTGLLMAPDQPERLL